MPQTTKQARKIYSGRIASGRCIRCGKKLCADLKTCAVCRRKRNKQQKVYLENRKENGICLSCGKQAENGLVRCLSCCDRQRQERQNLRVECLIAYGGLRCSCPGCMETHVEFLEIDHVNGGGNKHRRTIKANGTDFYRWLRANGFPKGFRVLCANCNKSRGNYGYCPHERGINNAAKSTRSARPV